MFNFNPLISSKLIELFVSSRNFKVKCDFFMSEEVFKYERTHINFVQKSQLSYFSSERGKKWEIEQIEYRTNMLIQILLFPLFPTINRNDICFLHYTKNKTSIWFPSSPTQKTPWGTPIFISLLLMRKNKWGFLDKRKGSVVVKTWTNVYTKKCFSFFIFTWRVKW